MWRKCRTRKPLIGIGEKMNADRSKERQKLLTEIAADAGRTAHYTGRATFKPEVMAALGRVPREAFVPTALRPEAYVNRPLPIGHRQTISQPYIVALMSDLLDLQPTDRVLEIGTGCGYQTAVLAELAGEVYTLEIITSLQAPAINRLGEQGYQNIQFQCSDGRKGWPDQAPFDAIIVTAAATEVPAGLCAQLAPEGRMLIPIGAQHETQFLTRIIRAGDGSFTKTEGLPVAFVPLVNAASG